MKKKGFTLIEIIVVSAIFLIIIGASFDFYISNIKILKMEKQKAYIDSEVKSLMDYINQSLQAAWQNTIEIEKDENKITMVIPKDNTISAPSDEGGNNGIIFTFQKEGSSIKITKEQQGVPTAESYSLQGLVKEFEVKQEPEGSNLVVITLTVDYEIEGKENKNYSIYYNIRKD
jgi:prepilin-type N-terminal cleavage/methylation domain-containing protein